MVTNALFETGSHEVNEITFPVVCDVFAKQNVSATEIRIGGDIACNHQELAICNEITRVRVPEFHPQKIQIANIMISSH